MQLTKIDYQTEPQEIVSIVDYGEEVIDQDRYYVSLRFYTLDDVINYGLAMGSLGQYYHEDTGIDPDFIYEYPDNPKLIDWNDLPNPCKKTVLLDIQETRKQLGYK